MSEHDDGERLALVADVPTPRAPRMWRNWRAARSGAPRLGITECSLFSDVWFVAEAVGYGPYSLLNPVAGTTFDGGMYEWKPALTLRVDHHLASEVPDMTVTDAEHYHGGWLEDEVAALVALIFGARVIAGPVTREFEDHGDPLGRPRTHSAGRLPVQLPRVQAAQIPTLLGQRDLKEIGLLSTLPDLTVETATALIKSARSYQKALWLSDTAPELAWLLFVSAIETAAGHWDLVELSPVERLELSYPRMVKRLREKADESLVADVAGEMRKVIGATSKFRGFCRRFKPHPPADRPQFGQFDFDDANYRDAIAKIYDYRSRALHGGSPFPHPMCMPPMSYSDDGRVEERPTGLAASSYSATWLAEDLPMYLHTFAYIARGVILNWWRSLAEPAADGAVSTHNGSPAS